jgi:hypothetical protein
MVRLSLVLILFCYSVGLLGQAAFRQTNPAKDCESYPGLVDSIYDYKWDRTINQWTENTIRHYNNDGGRYNRLVFINAADRKTIRAWDYYYDSNGNRNLEISSAWANNNWVVNLKKESEFDSNNKKLSELRLYFKSSKWNFVSFTYYEYNNERISKVHYQEKDNSGALFDASYSEYFYDNDRLIEVRSYSGVNDQNTGIDRYFHDDQTGKLTERILFSAEYDEDGLMNLVPYQMQAYYYDDYQMLRQVIFHELRDGNWEQTSKNVYFYRLDNARKVTICHNNISICVSVNALKAHLAHGDKIGPCNPLNEKLNGGQNPDKNKKDKLPFTVFPNPATDRITLRIEPSYIHQVGNIELVDTYGKTVRSYNAHQRGEIIIPREGLIQGQYFLKIIGETVYSVPVVFK